MNQKLFRLIVIFILGSIALHSLTYAQSYSSNDERPNILLIIMDGQEWETIVNRSICNTPNINRLAEKGMLFNRSYTANPLCCPSRAMLLTGAYPWHNGVYNQVHSAPSVSRDMRHDVITYAMKARKSGYNTGYVGKWHATNERTPIELGYNMVGAPASVRNELLSSFDYIDQKNKDISYTPVKTFQWPGSEPFGWWGFREGEDESTYEWGMAETGIQIMKQFIGEDKPWLLEVHIPQPVHPYIPLSKYLQRYNPASIPIPDSFYDSFKNKPALYRREAEGFGKITPEIYQQGKAYYYAHIEQIDAQIGRIIEELDKTGQAENTIVITTTDHGNNVGEHRIWGMGPMPAESTYRIPMVIRWPKKIKPGIISNHLVQLHDLAHTFTDVMGLSALPFADGRSLVPLFEQPDKSDWRDHILCVFYGGEYLYTQRIAITERYKYSFNGFDFDECYDLGEDPNELYNIIDKPEYKEVVDDMRARLYELMNQYEDPYGETQNSISTGKPPNRWCAPRYLPKGKRISKTIK